MVMSLLLLLLPVALPDPSALGRGVAEIKDATDAYGVSGVMSTSQVYGL